MNLLVFVLYAVFAAWGAVPCLTSATGTSTHIQYMTPVLVSSPDCRWTLEVAIVETGGDEWGRVTVGDATGPHKPRRLLFQFQRDAVISWRSDGRILVVQDERGPLYSRLMLFDLAKPAQSAADALEPDRVVKADVERRMAVGHQLENYIPQFVAWAGSDAIVFVDAASIRKGTSGSLTGYCLAYRVGSAPVKILERLTEQQLARYGGVCPK